MENNLEKLKDLIKVLVKTLHHFFPAFRSWLNKPTDPRCQNKIKYPLCDLLFSGLLLCQDRDYYFSFLG